MKFVVFDCYIIYPHMCYTSGWQTLKKKIIIQLLSSGSHISEECCPYHSLPWEFQIIYFKQICKSPQLTEQGTHLFIIIIIIFLHGLGRLTCYGIDALPSFPRASTISSSSRFVAEAVFRESGVVHSFKMADPVCLCLDLTYCIPEISSSFLITSLCIFIYWLFNKSMASKPIAIDQIFPLMQWNVDFIEEEKKRFKHRPATSWVHYTTSCNTQSSAPEDG